MSKDGRLLKIGVIGVGHMGKNHVRILSEERQFFDLVGIYDRDYSQVEAVARNYSTKAYKDLSSLLKETEAVVIAVPSSLHKEVSAFVADNNVNALIEKPLALNSEDAREIIRLYHDRGLHLAVGHVERFNPVIMELDKFLNQELIFNIETHRYGPYSGSGRITDTSVIEDLMIHDIDLVCHLMGNSRIRKIYGVGERIRSDKIDFATSVLEFDNNAHAIVSVSRVSQNKERSLYIHTEDSFLYGDLLSKSLTISKNMELAIVSENGESYKQDGVVQKIFVPLREPLRTELIAFYNTVKNNENVSVTGETALKSIEICEEVIRQIAL